MRIPPGLILLTLIIVVLGYNIASVTRDHEVQKIPEMYGSYTCPHCIDQKTRILPEDYAYIECNTPEGQPKACKEQKISLYPTWIFPSGCRVEGEINQTQFNDLKNGGVCP